jgi:hypothetical protein
VPFASAVSGVQILRLAFHARGFAAYAALP